ncbi:hypothetical protein SLOPH_2505, partial [Spraguea lophii 42_110]
MTNFLNLFIIFITLNYESFLHNIKASNNNIGKKGRKEVLTLENIQEKKYEINGTVILFASNYSTYEKKCVKITEIEYDGIKIRFTDKNHIPVDMKDFEFHRIISGDLKPNECDYYFKITSIFFKVTAFIGKKCFYTTLWYSCFMDPIKISTPLYDQLTKLLHRLNSNDCYKYIILPQNWFDNTTYFNEHSENQNIYDVDILKVKKIISSMYALDNLTIIKNSNTYNINYFRLDRVDSELYTKIYYTTNYGLIEGY